MWKFPTKKQRARVRLANYKANKLNLILVYGNLTELFTVYRKPHLFGAFNFKHEVFSSKKICEVIIFLNKNYVE